MNTTKVKFCIHNAYNIIFNEKSCIIFALNQQNLHENGLKTVRDISVLICNIITKLFVKSFFSTLYTLLFIKTEMFTSFKF